MRKIVVHEFITLDGVIQAPGGKNEDTEGGFNHGGWTMPYWHDDIGKRFFETMNDVDAFLLGRKTWQIHSVFETMDGDPFADALNKIHKFVVSTTLKSTDAWRNSTLVKSNIVAEVKKLKGKEGKNIMIDGSSVLLKTLIENELVDEFDLHVYPLVLGKGKKLFPEDKKVALNFVKSKPLPTGVVFMQYQFSKSQGNK